MTWDAVGALDDALAETRALLTPLDLGVWSRLAVITLFAGLSAPQTPTVSVDAPPNAVINVAQAVTTAEVRLAVAAIGVTVVVIAAVAAALGAVMEFVLVAAARSQVVRIAAPFRAHLAAGLRLLAFRIVIVGCGLVATALVASPIGAALAFDQAWWLLALVVTLPLGVVVGVGAALASEFTTAFVVPLMAADGCGVREGWRRLSPVVRADWQEFAVYVLVKAVLLFGASIAVGFCVAVIVVPFGAGALLAGAVSGGGAAVLAVTGVVGVVAVAAVSVVSMTFLRYHSLLVLDRSAVAFALR
ncbi:hypothetical protein KVP04_10190 [Halobacterium salinarum]|uniref:DUF7544 domain-containing protein n=1 Tax=Halobacterium salinarum TaxID=2242 RepID=UPI001F3CC056|nr:hypothetical protein [Halobacterium salinarum]MCF2239493.1 hypothetical protein [Halobacterium salinarum]